MIQKLKIITLATFFCTCSFLSANAFNQADVDQAVRYSDNLPIAFENFKTAFRAKLGLTNAQKLTGIQEVQLVDEFKQELFGGRIAEIGNDFNLSSKDFCNAELVGLDLRWAKFSISHFEEANFFGSNLSGALFDFAVIKGVNFTFANLMGADLRESLYYEAEGNFSAIKREDLVGITSNIDGALFTGDDEATLARAREEVLKNRWWVETPATLAQTNALTEYYRGQFAPKGNDFTLFRSILERVSKLPEALDNDVTPEWTNAEIKRQFELAKQVATRVEIEAE